MNNKGRNMGLKRLLCGLQPVVKPCAVRGVEGRVSTPAAHVPYATPSVETSCRCMRASKDRQAHGPPRAGYGSNKQNLVQTMVLPSYTLSRF